MKEILAGRYAGPFPEIPFEYYMQSPLGLVPKSGNQTRLIFHLSYNFGDADVKKSLNFHTPSDWCTVKYNDLDYAVQTCIDLRKQIRGMELLENEDPLTLIGRKQSVALHFSKSDLRAAFRLLQVLLAQRCYLIMYARHLITKKGYYFVEKNLHFGASISCARFQLFSDALKHIFEFVTGYHFRCTNYLDDYLFTGASKLEANRMVRSFLNLCEDIGCEVALDKTEYAEKQVVFLGILLDGEWDRLSVPQDKAEKAVKLLKWTIEKKKVTVKHIQRLTEVLNFLNRAIVPGRAFTRRMYSKLRITDKEGNSLKHYHHVTLGAEFVNDCKVWLQFLSEIATGHLCRPFLDTRAFEYAETLNFYTDASLNRNFGLGGIYNNRFIVGRWGAVFIEMQKPSIEFLELFALTAGILTWGHLPELSNKRLIIFCDNTAVMDMVNQFTSSCEHCMKLIRILALNGLRYNRRLLVKHVRSKNNILADSLSRMNFKRFRVNAPVSMNWYPDKIAPEIWSIDKIWSN